MRHFTTFIADRCYSAIERPQEKMPANNNHNHKKKKKKKKKKRKKEQGHSITTWSRGTSEVAAFSPATLLVRGMCELGR